MQKLFRFIGAVFILLCGIFAILFVVTSNFDFLVGDMAFFALAIGCFAVANDN